MGACNCKQNIEKKSDLITGVKEKNFDNTRTKQESIVSNTNESSNTKSSQLQIIEEEREIVDKDLIVSNNAPSENMKSSFLKGDAYSNIDFDNKTDLSNNKIPTKKKRKFDVEFLEILNEFRSNPKPFAEKILALEPEIKKVGDKTVLSRKGIAKIVMNTGVEALYTTAKYISELEPMSKLEYSKKIEIDIPEMENWLQYSELVDKKTQELKVYSKYKYNSFSFHFDLSINDPELSFLMQIIDDNTFEGRRRKHICDPDMKFIGLTYSQVTIIPDSGVGLETKKKEKRFCAYFCFAK